MTFLYTLLLLFLLVILVEVIIPYLIYRFLTRMYLAFKIAELRSNVQRIMAAQELLAERNPNYEPEFIGIIQKIE